MSDLSPIKQFWIGLWTAIGGFVGLALCTWLSTRIPGLQEPVINAVFGLVPPYRLVWPTSIVLFLVGIVCFGFAFRELVNLGITQAAERIRAGNPTPQDMEIAHYVIENAKKKNPAA